MAAGELDRSFGDRGIVLTDFGTADAGIRDLTIHADGRIIAAGYAYGEGEESGSRGFAVARYLPDGRLDPGFGAWSHLGAGRIRFGVSPGQACAYCVALQPDGRILLGGFAGDSAGSTGERAAVLRLNPDGSPDSGFGRGGLVTLVLGAEPTQEAVHDLVMLDDGRIVLCGRTRVPTEPGYPYDDRFALAALFPEGRRDTAFGDGGSVVTYVGLTDFYEAGPYIRSAGRQPRDLILTGGLAFAPVEGFGDRVGRYAFGLARFLPSGVQDVRFGHFGAALATYGDFAGAHAHLHELALTANFDIRAAGSAVSRRGNRAFVVGAWGRDGQRDESFAEAGFALTEFPGGAAEALALALQSDEKPVAGGYAPLRDGRGFALVRYGIQGSLDGGFGVLGLVRTAVGSGDDSFISALGIKDGGAIVAAGEALDRRARRFALACYSAGPGARRPYWPGAFLRVLIGWLRWWGR